MFNKEEISKYSSSMIDQYKDIYKIDVDLYDEYNVKRGLRDKNGNGVLAGISDISRIDADLVGTVFDRRDRQFIVKMNIRYQWDRNLLFDLFQCTRSFLCRNCTSYNIASCCSQSLDLCHSCPHIFCFCICHGLDQDRISASDHPVADLYHFCMFSVHKSDVPNVSKADQNRIPSLTYVRLDFTVPVFHISQNNIPDQNTSAHRLSP